MRPQGIERMGRFTERTQHFLIQAGWFPGRRVDTAKYAAAFAAGGFTFDHHSERILSEFGDLFVRVDFGDGYAPNEFCFDADVTIGEYDMDDLRNKPPQYFSGYLSPLGWT